MLHHQASGCAVTRPEMNIKWPLPPGSDKRKGLVMSNADIKFSRDT